VPRSVAVIQCSDGPLAVISAVAEQLIERGEIWRDSDGRFRTHGPKETISKIIIDADCGVCDFCSAACPTVVFEAEDFDMTGFGNMSTGGWAACATCAPLVRGGRRQELLLRAIAGISNPKSPREKEAIISLHEKFWNGRSARARRDEQELINLTTEEIETVAHAPNNKVVLPDGFYPHSFVTFISRFMEELPDVAIKLAFAAHPNCTTHEIGPGVDVIQRLEADGLIRFAERIATGDPALFMAAKHEFTHIEDLESADRIVGCFPVGGEFDATSGEIVSAHRQIGDIIVGEPATVQDWIDRSSSEVRRISEDLKLSWRIVRETLFALEARGLLTIKALEDAFAAHILVKNVSVLTETEKKIVGSIERLFSTESRGKLRMSDVVDERPGSHTYMRAIEQQYAALEGLLQAIPFARAKGITMANGVFAADNYERECQILKRAETFCWFDEPTRAVVSAAITLPSSVRLDKDLTTSYAGWWYFVNPIDCQTMTQSNRVQAISWSWAVINEKRAVEQWLKHSGTLSGVLMSAWVFDDKIGLMPSTEFFWGEGCTLQQMLSDMEISFKKTFADDPAALERLPTITMPAVEKMGRFFAAGNLWIQQKILVKNPRSMERHARKRLDKEKGHLRPLSDVQIIQLRRREVVALSTRPANGEAVDWKCRWIVGGTQGFWRNQWYPSKGYHQPKHIDPFIKGPDDKPLKVPTHRVYSVNR
jgi:predicted DNA-binding transcriptional regulator